MKGSVSLYETLHAGPNGFRAHTVCHRCSNLQEPIAPEYHKLPRFANNNNNNKNDRTAPQVVNKAQMVVCYWLNFTTQSTESNYYNKNSPLILLKIIVVPKVQDTVSACFNSSRVCVNLNLIYSGFDRVALQNSLGASRCCLCGILRY